MGGLFSHGKLQCRFEGYTSFSLEVLYYKLHNLNPNYSPTTSAVAHYSFKASKYLNIKCHEDVQNKVILLKIRR